MGSQFNESGKRTLVAAEAISKYLRMYIDSNGKFAVAGAGIRCDAISVDNCASAEDCTGHLYNAPGTVMVTAAGVVAKGDLLYGAASGKVSTTLSGAPQFVALEAATGDGAYIEAVPLAAAQAGFQPSTDTVEAHTAGDTLLAAETGSLHTNTGASGTITIVLPAATPGLKFRFACGAAQALRIDPNGSETISLPSTGVPGAGGKYLWADAIGESVDLECTVAGSWQVFGYTGTWTAEP